ncbi:MAG: hypothetical protein ACW98F_19195 [Candidatus Hodarchaeales archaeon]
MNTKTRIIILFLMILLTISSGSTSIRGGEQELRWDVDIGENATYRVEKYFDDTDNDGDGDKKTQMLEITDENGERREVTIQKGSTIKVVITELNDEAKIKLTYNDNVTSQEQVDSVTERPFVTKTVFNNSYWEEWAEGKDDYSVIGHLLIKSSVTTVAGVTTELIIKRNWRIGWLVYVSRKTYNDSGTISEMELIQSVPNAPELKWKVKVGDSQNYTIMELYDQSDIDRDGNPNFLTTEIESENGDLINVTVKKGSNIEVEIAELGFFAILKYTYNGEVSTKAQDDSSLTRYVMQTVDDKSYWEDWVQFKKNYLIEGPFLVESLSSQINEDITSEFEIKRDWKTGWIMYQRWRIYNDSTVVFHHEFCATSYEPFSSESTTTHLTCNSLILMMMGISVVAILKKEV